MLNFFGATFVANQTSFLQLPSAGNRANRSASGFLRGLLIGHR